MLNRITSGRPTDGEAELRYLDADFRIVRPGSFVRCAVTGKQIPLSDLKYWNVDRQEAYAGAEESLKRYLELRAKAVPKT